MADAMAQVQDQVGSQPASQPDQANATPAFELIWQVWRRGGCSGCESGRILAGHRSGPAGVTPVQHLRKRYGTLAPAQMPKAMAEESFNPRTLDRQPGASRGDRELIRRDPGSRDQGGRDQGGRDQGGFRIRLSDNEMRAARAVQEAFGLRSTVAALGMALRTTAQLLEQGQLDELVAQHQSQSPARSDGPRNEGPRNEGPRNDAPRGGGPRQIGRGAQHEGRAERVQRVDPFARPSRPAPQVEAPAADEEPQIDPLQSDASEQDATQVADPDELTSESAT